MKSARVMVVEDEALVGMQIKEGLETRGYAVPVVALSGEEALEKLADTEPDLVVMDIRLRGGMNGVEAARRIRQTFDIPIIYLTAYSDDETLKQAQATEPYGFVLKPYDERALHAAVQMALFKAERKRETEERERWIASVPDNIHDALIVSDAKGTIKFLNPAAEALLHIDRKDVIDRRLPEILSLKNPLTRQRIPFPVSGPLVEGRSSKQGDSLLIAAGGREKQVECSISPLRDAANTLFGLIFVFRDLTEERRAFDLVPKEMEEIARMRRRLLPPRDEVLDGTKFTWLFHPSSVAAGDVINWFRLDGTRVGFYALDVLGHGIVPTLFSMTLHRYLCPDMEQEGLLLKRTGGGQEVRDPMEVVQELQRRLYQRDQGNPVFTMVYGIVDGEAEEILLVRAGFPYPILQSAAGELKMVRNEGFAVGLFPDAAVTEERIPFRRQDRLILCSDGMVDCASGDGTFFSLSRVVEVLARERRSTLKAVADALERDLVAWRGSERFDDDVTAVLLERQ